MLEEPLVLDRETIQKKALSALYGEAKKEDIYVCEMPYGLDRTLLALKHVEEIQAQEIRVLLPSLDLLNQTCLN